MTEDGEQEEWISAGELANRLGCSSAKVYALAKEKKLKRNDFKKFQWPQAREQYITHERTKKSMQISNKGKRGTKKAEEEQEEQKPANLHPGEIRINEGELKDTSVVERIIAELKAGIEGSEATAYHYGRAMNELIKAQREQLKLLELEGKTLKKAEVEEWVFNMSRHNRNVWLQWPDLISVELAEMLGCDRRVLYNALLEQVRKNLDKIATLPISFGANPASVISEGAEASSEIGLG